MLPRQPTNAFISASSLCREILKRVRELEARIDAAAASMRRSPCALCHDERASRPFGSMTPAAWCAPTLVHDTISTLSTAVQVQGAP